MNDAVFASMLDKRFKKSKNPHKFAILWTSKFYRAANGCMRSTSIDFQVQTLPHAIYFIQNYMEYFFKHGVYKKDIQKDSNRLFRGYKSQFSLPVNLIDDGFISVSIDIGVAKIFAANGGSIITFKTKQLPKNVPFVKITREIAPHYSEQEYVFLPGTITSSHGFSEYKCNFDLVNMYRALPLSNMIGGVASLEESKIDLCGKLVVWYRVIYNRPPEIIGITKLPKTIKAVLECWKGNVEDNDIKYEDATLLIPEYQDFIKMVHDTSLSVDERIEISRKITSYTIYNAIVERGTINILTSPFPFRVCNGTRIVPDPSRAGRPRPPTHPIFGAPPRGGSCTQRPRRDVLHQHETDQNETSARVDHARLPDHAEPPMEKTIVFFVCIWSICRHQAQKGPTNDGQLAQVTWAFRMVEHARSIR